VKETWVRNAICSWLRLHKALVFIHDSVGIYDPVRKTFLRNFNPYRIPGVSDLIGIWRSKFLAIEVKSQTGRLKEHQARFLSLVNEHGGIAFMARGIEDVERELRLRGEYP
jgi:penicillin-binding protein-related factor A (putative recombinase)